VSNFGACFIVYLLYVAVQMFKRFQLLWQGTYEAQTSTYALLPCFTADNLHFGNAAIAPFKCESDFGDLMFFYE
jgi:hypothetical protein